jgi:hypothetical protein
MVKTPIMIAHLGRTARFVSAIFWVSAFVSCNAAPRSNLATTDPGGISSEGGRVRLTAPADFFVSPMGSDGADGLTTASPWQTLQHAYDTIKNDYDRAGFVAAIHLADGTYGPVNGKDNVVYCDGYVVGQVADVRFVGNPQHPENVVITVRSNNIFEIMNTRVNIDGLTLTGTGSSVWLLSYFGGRITFAHLIFGPMGSGIHLSAYGGIILSFSDYQITGGAGYHMLSNTPGSRIHVDNKIITLSGTPRFSAAFAVAENLGLISAYGNKFPGTEAKGTRYIVIRNAVIQTSGGADYFPGDAPGSAAAGGVYAGD